MFKSWKGLYILCVFFETSPITWSPLSWGICVWECFLLNLGGHVSSPFWVTGWGVPFSSACKHLLLQKCSFVWFFEPDATSLPTVFPETVFIRNFGFWGAPHWIWYTMSFSHSPQHIAHPKASSALEICLSCTWGCTATKLLLCSRYRLHCTCRTIAYFSGYCPADDLQWNHKQSLNTLETSLFFKVISQPPHEQVQWYTQFSPKQERFVVSQTVVQQDIRSSVECRSQSLL